MGRAATLPLNDNRKWAAVTFPRASPVLLFRLVKRIIPADGPGSIGSGFAVMDYMSGLFKLGSSISL